MNLGVAVKAAFKVPTLRNIELTGPYMHNGSMATLEQVIEFYGRQGNFHNENLHFQVSTISSSINSPANRADLIAYLKAFTDDRVRYEKAPFDHPEVVVPNGHEGNHEAVVAGNPLQADLAKDEVLVVPAVARMVRQNLAAVRPVVGALTGPTPVLTAARAASGDAGLRNSRPRRD